MVSPQWNAFQYAFSRTDLSEASARIAAILRNFLAAWLGVITSLSSPLSPVSTNVSRKSSKEGGEEGAGLGAILALLWEFAAGLGSPWVLPVCAVLPVCCCIVAMFAT